MKIHAVGLALVLAGLMTLVLPSLAMAQPKDAGAAAPAPAKAAAPKATLPNTNTNPAKHRYWRHRGGQHPHFGSRRVRT